MKEITKQEYLLALGLMQVAGRHMDMLNSCEEALGTLLGEKKEHGSWGHSGDEMYGDRDVDALLERLDIKIKKGK